MAIYSLGIHPVRKAGTATARAAHHTGVKLSHGAVGKSAYLSGKCLTDDRGVVTDYTSKAAGVEHSELLLPDGTINVERERLWNAVDSHPTKEPPKGKEFRPVVARDVIVAIPYELSSEQRITAARDFCKWITNRYQVPVELGVHFPDTKAGSSEKNAHFHALVGERKISHDGSLTTLQREFNSMDSRPNEKRNKERRDVAAIEIRKSWERIANDALERGGHQERIDCRSHKARGIDAEPGKHLGAAATRRLRESGKEKSSERASELNADKADKSRDLKSTLQLTKEIDGLQRELERKVRNATQQIEAIQERRRTHIEADVQSHIGGLDAWAEDAAGQFGRAWKSEDRAQRIRKRIREIEETRRIMREPTAEETAELTSIGRMRSRSNTLLDRSERVAEKLSVLDSDIKFDVGNGPMTKKRLTKVEAEVDRHLEKQRERSRDAGFGLEMEL